jgi:hypothetical protein
MFLKSDVSTLPPNPTRFFGLEESEKIRIMRASIAQSLFFLSTPFLSGKGVKGDRDPCFSPKIAIQ